MKWALVTGASGGIGTAVARRLAQEGWSLYLHYYSNHAQAAALLREFQESYSQQEFLLVQFDMEQEDMQSLVKSQIFSLDAIVFAHGTAEYGLLGTLRPERMDQLWRMHLKTPLLLIQLLEEKLSRSEQARIVFVSSVYGLAGSSNEVFYSTIKGAQIAFVRAYSKEVASRGITVNAICPGAVQTAMNQHFSEEDLAVLLEDIPLGRLGQPEEIGFWAAKLLEKDSGYMTGQALSVSGGWLA